MKKFITMVMAAFILGSSMTAAAQDDKKDKKQKKDKTEMLNKRATRVANDLKLDDKTTAWFIPLYVEYQDTLQAVNRPQMPKPDGEKKAKKAELSDDEALKLIEDNFAKSEKRTALQREYFKKFKEKLTPKQLVSIFVRGNEHPNMQRGNNQQRGNMQGQGMPGGFPPQGGGGFGGDF